VGSAGGTPVSDWLCVLTVSARRCLLASSSAKAASARSCTHTLVMERELRPC
jgi:hypothetical protein